MGKKNRKNRINTAQAQNRQQAKRVKIEFVDRPFAGIPAEVDLVAMRELIPAAVAKIKTSVEYGEQELYFATLLPNAVPALRRKDGVLLLAMQTSMHSGDASRDLAYALLKALELKPGEVLTIDTLPEPGPRLQEVVDWSQDFAVEVHRTFDFWIDPEEAAKPEVKQQLEELVEQTVETAAVEGVTGAYWCKMNKNFVRWSRPEDEYDVLDGLARLQAKRELQVTPGSKFLGAFRSCGVLVPVWEVPDDLTATELSKPMREFDKVLTAAIAERAALTEPERRAKAGIISRQVTLR